MSEQVEDLKKENEGLREDIENLQFHLENAERAFDPKLAQSIGFLGLCIMQASVLPRSKNGDELMTGAMDAFRSMFVEEHKQ